MEFGKWNINQSRNENRIIWVYDEIIGPKKISKRLELKKVSSNFEANLRKNGYTPFARIKKHEEKIQI